MLEDLIIRPVFNILNPLLAVIAYWFTVPAFWFFSWHMFDFDLLLKVIHRIAQHQIVSTTDDITDTYTWDMVLITKFLVLFQTKDLKICSSLMFSVTAHFKISRCKISAPSACIVNVGIYSPIQMVYAIVLLLLSVFLNF